MTHAALPQQHAPLTQYLDKGASLDPEAPCVSAAGCSLTYADVQALSHQIARALARSGVRPGDKVALLSGDDPTAFVSAFACVFGIARAGAVFCPIDGRNDVIDTIELLDLVECVALLYTADLASTVARIRPDLPAIGTWVCLAAAGAEPADTPTLEEWLDEFDDGLYETELLDDLAMIIDAGIAGGVKGVMLTGHNLETMTLLTLAGHRFEGCPVFLLVASLSQTAGVLCFPILAAGGEIVITPAPDPTTFPALIARHRVTHTFLTPTLVDALLDEPALSTADLSSLQTFWYGGEPMAAAALTEALLRIGPMAQLFGQTEAPLTISMMSTAEHYRSDGSLALERFASVGRPAPLVSVAIMDGHGQLLPPGVRGEIVLRGSLVMAGYYRDPAATVRAFRHGWHHTGDIGYLDDDHFLYVVDRIKNVITADGFDVYATEVENALLAHPDVRDCAVVGLPDARRGERVTAVVLLRPDSDLGADGLRAFVRARIGSAKTPQQIEFWPDLPRSRSGKVLKTDIRARLAV